MSEGGDQQQQMDNATSAASASASTTTPADTTPAGVATNVENVNAIPTTANPTFSYAAALLAPKPPPAATVPKAVASAPTDQATTPTSAASTPTTTTSSSSTSTTSSQPEQPATQQQQENKKKKKKKKKKKNPNGEAQNDNKRVRSLVVDTGALIKGVKLHEISSEFWTVEEVLNEVKDKKTKEFLAAFPFEIKTREPSPEALKAVVAFARKTGDLGSLSGTDLKVIALTYMLEKEINGGRGLRTEPRPPRAPRPRPTQNLNDDTASVTSEVSETASETYSETSSSSEQIDFAPITTEATTTPTDVPSEVTSTASTSTPTTEVKSEQATDTSKEPKETTAPQTTSEPVATEASLSTSNNTSEASPSVPSNETPAPSAVPISQSPSPALSESSTSTTSTSTSSSHPYQRREKPKPMSAWPLQATDDEESGWITPDNISKMSNQYAVRENRHRINVGCITVDFSIQNVLLQMGMKVISVDGLMIKTVRQWVLKCHACFNITRDVTKQFCPKCGLHTLIKISMRVDADGNISYSDIRKPIDTRGTRFAIPLPKGGRNNKDLILSEDQLMMRQKAYGKKKSSSSDFFDPDFEFFSDSRTQKQDLVVGYGKKNPNVPKRKLGKKKKHSGNQ